MEEPEKKPLPESENIGSRIVKSHSHTEELVDHYWGSINYVLGLIRASEVKAGLILSFYGILFNFVFSQMETVITEGSVQIILYVQLVIWFLCTVTSIYFSVRCFMPRIEGKYDKNVFFFGDVISKFGTIKEFSRTFYKISLDEEELFDQLGQQIFVISEIAHLKFKYVNRSLQFLGLGLLVFLSMVAYYIVVIIS